jgi:two-component system phosphate regulon sensor histidine kinase PhoR
MKKTFPFLFTLIGLSILGILFIQITWLQGLFLLQKNQLVEKVNQAGVIVSADLGKKLNGGLAFHFPKKSLSLSGGGHTHSFEEATLSDLYSFQDLDKRLKAALVKYGLQDLAYEFALQDKNGIIEIKSKQFEDVFLDELNTVQTRISIIPQEILETTGPFETLIIIVPNVNMYLFKTLQWVLFGAFLFIITVLAAFLITIRSLIKQRKLSEIKSDFINNMTHELKTPLATISLAVDALKSNKVQADAASVDYFSSIIKEENIRMNKHVETILQAALLEKKENVLNRQLVNINELIQGVIDSFKLQLDGKPSAVHTQFEAISSEIWIDEEYFLHVLSNLMDNAIKYAKTEIDIIIKTKTVSNKLIITVEDKGIGMTPDTVKHIFEKFYRAHSGNIHNVKGFGLGMSYVKWVIDLHKGNIHVTSELDKGTKVEISLPMIEPK